PNITGNLTFNLINTNEGEIIFTENIEIQDEMNEFKDDNQKNSITGRFASGEANPIILLGIVAIILILFYKMTKKKINKIEVYLHKMEPVFIFLISYFLVSTVLHELFHILVLEYFSCPFELDIGILKPKSVIIGSCSINPAETIVILSSGLLGNFIVFFGLILTFIKKYSLRSMNYLLFSYGFLFSLITYLFYERGDIHSILHILNIDISQIYLNVIGISLISVTLISLFYIDKELILNSS
ncbi:MAG: hypothetical protein ABEK17_01355, partial [Candidatus Aenigmatarchaeota archaeon]